VMTGGLHNEEAGSLATPTSARHIGKRARKNKSLTVSFDEKDLKYNKNSNFTADSIWESLNSHD
jgi:hypothetical protein